MRIHRPAAIAALLAFASVGGLAPRASADGEKTPPVFRFEDQDRRLSVEVLDDDLFHFEYCFGDTEWIDATRPPPMTAKRDYSGPRTLKREGNRIETGELIVVADPDAFAYSIELKRRGGDNERTITKLSSWVGGPPAKKPPKRRLGERVGFTFDSQHFRGAYGLGEELLENDKAGLSWRGLSRLPADAAKTALGNALVPFRGGAVGNAQFPILYVPTDDGQALAIFVDTTEALFWKFTEDPWRVVGRGPVFRFYVLVGPDLADVRRDFMELVGRPPVPPKAAFGLWVSEYGYDNWAELEDKLKTLKAAKFPLDGMVLDLQWFGGIGKDGKGCRMGAIDWDRKAFPDPAKKIAELREKHGIGLIPIEEPYVSTELADFKTLEKDGVLVKSKENGPAAVMKSWWGNGGMVDFTSESAGNEWHDRRRKPLIDAGIAGHWTDLGEPENYPDAAWYHGFGAGHDQAANHNMYNFAWAASIARGYERQKSTRRPLILSRSGTAGVQRFGVAMWSGDIGSNMPSLRAHFRAQAHMSLSGVDYFGSDIGGFHRKPLDGDLNDLYTRWFANSCLIDVPVRPHTSNTDNSKETAPDRIGDTASNLANIRRRYELIPYLYSLAHEAYRTGEPVFPPLVYHFESDEVAQTLTDHKMIGPWLLAAMITEYKTDKRDVYLPAGVWFDYESDERFDSKGEWIRDVPINRNGKIMAPLFVRAGAIIPLAYVDENTMNTAGKQLDGARNEKVRLRVYPAETGSTFKLYEDDGETVAYMRGAIRTTAIHQKIANKEIQIELEPSTGNYIGSLEEREWYIDVITGKYGGYATSGTVESDGVNDRSPQRPYRRQPIQIQRAETTKHIAKVPFRP